MIKSFLQKLLNKTKSTREKLLLTPEEQYENNVYRDEFEYLKSITTLSEYYSDNMPDVDVQYINDTIESYIMDNDEYHNEYLMVVKGIVDKLNDDELYLLKKFFKSVNKSKQ